MKSCPTCNKTFTDPNLSFCIDDGTPLVSVAEPADETTVVSPSSGDSESIPPPTEVYKPRDWQAPDYQPPGFQTSTAAPTRKKTWPWVVGILAVLAIGVIGIGIAGAILVPKMLRTASNRNSSNPSVERSGDPNSNLNSNAPVSNSNNENSDTPVEKDNATEDDATPPPTDKDVVLAALTRPRAGVDRCQHQCRQTETQPDSGRRLRRDVQRGQGSGESGVSTDHKRDTAIQKWEFEDLKVTLMGDRATLDGVLRLQLPDQEAAYRFTDKFVWRDGRWQAVGSEVSRIK